MKLVLGAALLAGLAGASTPAAADSAGPAAPPDGAEYVTNGSSALPLCLTPDKYDAALAAIQREDAVALRKTGCSLPVGGLKVTVLEKATEHLHKVQVTTPSGKILTAFAPLTAFLRVGATECQSRSPVTECN